MGRKADPNVAEKRQEARDLEKAGMTGPQIAAKMGVHLERVYSWLRGTRKPSYRHEIVERLKKGFPVTRIAEEVGCTEDNVRFYERKHRDELTLQVVDNKDPGKWVEEWVKNPGAKKKERYTRYESFGSALIDRLNYETNANPRAAKELINSAIELFGFKLKRARRPGQVRVLTCNLIQATAILAARERALQRPEKALELLRRVRDQISGCDACAADLSRREAIVLRDLKGYPDALRKLRVAQNLYQGMGHSGHDYSRNGMGNCANALVLVYLYMRKPNEAVQAADTALQDFVQSSEKGLYWRIRFNKTLALLELDVDSESIAATQVLSKALLAECGPKSTIPRMHSAFLCGRAAELGGNLAAAIGHYEDGFEDAQQLKIPEAAAAFLSDLERISSQTGSLEPTGLQSRIDRLRNEVDGKDQPSFPSWLQPIKKVLNKAYQISTTDLEAALLLLRRESGGDKYLPRNLAMLTS